MPVEQTHVHLKTLMHNPVLIVYALELDTTHMHCPRLLQHDQRIYRMSALSNTDTLFRPCLFKDISTKITIILN